MFKTILKINFIIFFISSLSLAQTITDIKVDGNTRISKESIIVFGNIKFDKDYPLTYQEKDILKDTHYVVDMSTIKNDGGGSQYTFLEAIYQGCVLVLHREWITSCSLFKEGVNCLAAETPEELASILSEPRDITNLIKESRKLLQPHVVVKW